MNNIVVKEDFHIHINQENVLQLIQLNKDSHIFDETMKEYDALEQIVLNTIRPKAVLAFSVIRDDCNEDILKVLPVNSRVLYSIITLGDEISRLYQYYFDKGEYVKGLLVDSMADTCLFAMEEELKGFIISQCEIRNIGVGRRYDAPVNIPMPIQRTAYNETEAGEYLNLHITKGFMLDPVKSLCQVFALTTDKVFKLDHDCNSCDAIECQLRQALEVKLVVITKKREIEIKCKNGESLLKAMIRYKIPYPAVCGGNGLCGKCSVRVLQGELPVTKADEKYFTGRELSNGLRLACMAYPEKYCKIALEAEEEDGFEILSEFKNNKYPEEIEQSEDYALAVDIGTTTLAISLVERKHNKIVDTYTALNHQRLYGADVISRIKSSVEGKKKQLRLSICKDLLDGFLKLLNRQKISGERISEIVIAGNTTMGHLLMGYDLDSLGAYPFRPVNIGLIRKSFKEIFMDSTMNCPVTILPGISAFVGGDIISGLYFNDFQDKRDINLLLDLGTNGEMVLGNQYRLLATATAAGPAFEGGNITWGMGSAKGAISRVTIQEEGVSIETIEQKEPIGICGTGVIEIMSELLRTGIADKTGLLKEEYRREGYPVAKSPGGSSITFTQKDIRELQLAKAAVRAGVEILLLRYGITWRQVDKVYLAGGFGYKINQDKAIRIGLLPEEFRGRIEAVGNSSLGGAVKYLNDKQASETFKQLKAAAKEINLPMENDFNNLYVKYMDF